MCNVLNQHYLLPIHEQKKEKKEKKNIKLRLETIIDFI